MSQYNNNNHQPSTPSSSSSRKPSTTPAHLLLKQQLREESSIISDVAIKEAENALCQLDNDLHRFNLATLYIRSNRSRAYVERGIDYIAELLNSEHHSSLLSSTPQHSSSSSSSTYDDNNSNANHYKRDCMYFMALGFYHLNDYSHSKQWIQTLQRYDPENRQAKNLLLLVEERIHEEGVKGLAIAGGAVAGGVLAVAGIVALALLRR